MKDHNLRKMRSASCLSCTETTCEDFWKSERKNKDYKVIKWQKHVIFAVLNVNKPCCWPRTAAGRGEAGWGAWGGLARAGLEAVCLRVPFGGTFTSDGAGWQRNAVSVGIYPRGSGQAARGAAGKGAAQHAALHTQTGARTQVCTYICTHTHIYTRTHTYIRSHTNYS